MLPGLLLAGLYIIYAITLAYFKPEIAPKPKAEEIPPTDKVLREVLVSFVPLFT